MRRLKVILGCPDDVETAAANDAPSCPFCFCPQSFLFVLRAHSLPNLCALIPLQSQILYTLHTVPIALLCPAHTFSRRTYSNSFLHDLHLSIHDPSTKISTTSPKKMCLVLGLFLPA